MSGMLGRVPVNVPALGTQSEVLVSTEGSRRFCKVWSRGVDLVVEPTSVLYIRSPSPSSTLSSSVAASSESGVQGFSETGEAVAVSAYECSEGQLVDCTSLLDVGHEDGSLWGLESVEDGGTWHDMVGTCKSNPSGMQNELERNVVRQDGVCKQYADGGPSSIQEVVPGYAARKNEESYLNAGFVKVLGMTVEKQGTSTEKEVLHKPERLHLVSSGLSGPVRSSFGNMMVKSEARGDETLEACVLSCRKREREDSLGEVVQRLSVGGQKIEVGDWLSDWTGFGDNAITGSAVEEKVAPPRQLGNLDDIFCASSSVVPPEFWLNENVPPMQKQIHSSGGSKARYAGDTVIPANNPQSSGKVQLDLFEAVQAGLLYKGGSNGGNCRSTSSSTSSPPLANISPSVLVPRSFSATRTSSLINQPFSTHGSPLLAPSQHHVAADSTSRAPAFLPGFFDTKLPPPAPSLLNASFAPAPPYAASHVRLQDLIVPLPAPYKKAAQAPQRSFLSFPRPECRTLKAVDFVEQKPWHISALEGAPPSNVIPGGPKWQFKPGPGWQLGDRLGAEHIRGPHTSSHSASPGEHTPLSQASGTEYVGRCVRLEELSLGEGLLCAAAEAAQLGDLSSAQAILARLNQQSFLNGQEQQLPPARRAAVLFGEALSKRFAAASIETSYHPLQQPPSNSALDLISKISAFKQFCEVSPISQFSLFTANQAILDAMEGEKSVHIVDFELGFGGQWASFMQEVSQRSEGPPELKLTTIGTDTLEMRLVKENLLQFAKEVGINLEVNVVAGQKLEGLKDVVAKKSEKEAVAINFGLGMSRLMSEFSSSMEEVLTFLQMVKGLCPKLVAVVDCECELEGPSSFMEALQFYSCVFESLEASTKLSAEVVHNIERLVFGPKITDLVNARSLHKSPGDNGLPPWRILLQNMGFTPFPFSIAAENQVTWLVKNPLNSGFTFLKQHATLLLAWYSKTLVSTSAWV